MNLKTSLLTAAILFAGTSFFSCSKKEDNAPADKTAPLLVSHKINNSILSGEKLEIELNFSDETELGQAKIIIHDAFDGHGHGRMSGSAFSFEKIFTLTGKTNTLKEYVAVPTDALTGNYHLLVEFTDKAGNEGIEHEHEFEITAKTQPVVAIQYPGQGVTLTRTFTASGGMTAQNGLKEAVMSLHPLSASGEAMAFVFEKKLIINDKPSSLGFDAFGEITLPASITAGNYEFRIKVTDMNGNTKTAKVSVKLV